MSKQEVIEAIHALGWIVEHLKHRPSLKDRVDLLTRDERKYLEDAHAKAIESMKPKIRFKCQKCEQFTEEPAWDAEHATCTHCGTIHRRIPCFMDDYWQAEETGGEHEHA